MTSFTDLHLELEIKAKDFRENPTEANGNKIIEEIVRLIKMNASILIDGVQSDVNKDITVPSGYYAKDSRFYIHIFSSKVAFDASTASNPFMMHMQDLIRYMDESEQIGGFSLNHTRETGAILITREDIASYMNK